MACNNILVFVKAYAIWNGYKLIKIQIIKKNLNNWFVFPTSWKEPQNTSNMGQYTNNP